MKRKTKKAPTSGFKFGSRSRKNLSGVHNDLVKVAHRALELSPVDFAITEGLRPYEKQKALFDEGKYTTTMNSRHLTGHAIDVAAWVSGDISWAYSHYVKISEAFKKASNELAVEIVWGGDWNSIKDGAHFELSWKHYPVNKG